MPLVFPQVGLGLVIGLFVVAILFSWFFAEIWAPLPTILWAATALAAVLWIVNKFVHYEAPRAY